MAQAVGCAGLLLLMLISDAAAATAVVPYQFESAFLSAVSIDNITTFDQISSEVTLGLGTATVDGIVYTATDATAVWKAVDYDVFSPQSSPNVFGNPYSGPKTKTLSFGPGQTVNAIGFYLQTPGGPNAWILTVTTAGGDSLTQNFSLGSRPTFFGFASTAGITSVEIADDPSDNRITNYYFDNVSRSAVVPEPSTLVLLGMGAVGLLAFAWRRRKA